MVRQLGTRSSLRTRFVRSVIGLGVCQWPPSHYFALTSKSFSISGLGCSFAVRLAPGLVVFFHTFLAIHLLIALHFCLGSPLKFL